MLRAGVLRWIRLAMPIRALHEAWESARLAEDRGTIIREIESARVAMRDLAALVRALLHRVEHVARDGRAMDGARIDARETAPARRVACMG